jgi:hypothetical protein
MNVSTTDNSALPLLSRLKEDYTGTTALVAIESAPLAKAGSARLIRALSAQFTTAAPSYAGSADDLWAAMCHQLVSTGLNGDEETRRNVLRSGIVPQLCRGAAKAMTNETVQATTSICGKQLKSGMFCYHCRDCEADRTCCLCAECFEEHKHVGHDYRLVSAGGGVCDCGDATAWNPAGFCSRHGRREGASSAAAAADLADIMTDYTDGDEQDRLQRRNLGTLPSAEHAVATRLVPLVIEALITIIKDITSTVSSLELLRARMTLWIG